MTMTSAVRVSCGLYRMLLFIYPSDFRLRFESEMVATFSDLLCGEWKQNGLPGVARVWRSRIGEMFSLDATPRMPNPLADSMVLILLFFTAFVIQGVLPNNDFSTRVKISQLAV